MANVEDKNSTANRIVACVKKNNNNSTSHKLPCVKLTLANPLGQI